MNARIASTTNQIARKLLKFTKAISLREQFTNHNWFTLDGKKNKWKHCCAERTNRFRVGRTTERNGSPNEMQFAFRFYCLMPSHRILQLQFHWKCTSVLCLCLSFFLSFFHLFGRHHHHRNALYPDQHKAAVDKRHRIDANDEPMFCIHWLINWRYCSTTLSIAHIRTSCRLCCSPFDRIHLSFSVFYFLFLILFVSLFFAVFSHFLRITWFFFVGISISYAFVIIVSMLGRCWLLRRLPLFAVTLLLFFCWSICYCRSCNILHCLSFVRVSFTGRWINGGVPVFQQSQFAIITNEFLLAKANEKW